MPAVPLPENASFEHLKSQAKLVRDLVAARDNGAIDMLREFHPSAKTSDTLETLISAFKLADAQLAVARLYGFSSWSILKREVELVKTFSLVDTADHESRNNADLFVSLACVSYATNDPRAKTEQAQNMLDADNGLSTANLASMAACGNQAAIADWLATIDDQFAAVNTSLGPNRWPPLLYCCYSRVTDPDKGFSAVETVRLLLEAGADANAGFLWRGLVPPFTALTGAFGRGEADQTVHPDRIELARLLLQHGADPNDGQALYNNGLAGSAVDDIAHLELLTEFGLGRNQGGPWYQLFGSRLTTPEELLYDEIEIAAHRGLQRRMQYLVDLGLDMSRNVGRSQQTAAELAERNGHTDILEILEQARGKTA